MSVFNRIRRILLLVVGTLLVGAAGFKILGGANWSMLDSIYMVVITLSSVGFQEVHPLNGAQKIWTIIVITFGLGIVFYAISQVTEFVLSFNVLRRKKMEDKALDLKQHFIVCGFGRMGKVICEELHNQSLPFLVIDSNPKKIEAIQEKGYVYIQGDATDDETLDKANIKVATGLVVVLSSDADILFVTMSARTLNPDLFITSRCSQEENVSKLMRAGANKVVNPYIAGGHKMADLLVAPYVEDSVEISTPTRSVDLLMEEIRVEYMDGYDGIPIRESRLREDFKILIAGLIDGSGEMIFNPDPATVLKDSYTLLLMGEKENLARFKEKACKSEQASVDER